MNFIYGLLTATGAIIAAEIVFNYGLGDVVKDTAVRIFGNAESFAHAQLQRLRAAVAKAEAKVKGLL